VNQIEIISQTTRRAAPTKARGAQGTRGVSIFLLCTMKAYLGAAIFSSAWAADSTSPTSSTSSTKPPNILFIISDDLGWNDVSFHGSQQIPTPTLDALATQNRSAILDQYYLQPVCSPTRATIMTGRHVIHTGVYDPMNGGTGDLSLNFTLLPQYLKSVGYDTHMIGKWHLGYSSARFTPTQRGFDSYFGYLDGGSDYWKHAGGGALDFWGGSRGEELQPDFSWSCFVKGAAANAGCPEANYSANVFSTKAAEVLRSKTAASKPWFMYLAYQSVHSPDEAPQHIIDSFGGTVANDHRRTFAAMVTALDDGVKNVTDALRETGQFDSTLLIFTSDNGGPADNFNANMASNYPLRGMKRTLWEGGTRGVGFVHGAGIPAQRAGAPSPVFLRGFIHIADWLPTLLTVATGSSAAGAALLANASLLGPTPFSLGDGMDLWPYLSGAAASSPRTEVIYEAHPLGSADGNGCALRVGRWKIVQRSGREWSTGSAIGTNDGWYGGPGSSDANTASYAVNATDYGKLTVKCGLPPPDLAGGFACVRNGSKTGYCLFDLDADPCEHSDLSAAQPAVLQTLVARLQAYRAGAVPASPTGHCPGATCNPDGAGCPGATGEGDFNRTQTICGNPGAPTPAPAPSPAVALRTTGGMCLSAPASGGAPALLPCEQVAGGGREWLVAESDGTITLAGDGSCLKLFEPTGTSCSTFGATHMGPCGQGPGGSANKFTLTAAGRLQSTQCAGLCLSSAATKAAEARAGGAAALVNCSAAPAAEWRVAQILDLDS
jgi:arylsulfatase A-like enzyme